MDISLESLFEKGKKYLIGKSKNIKLAIENYDLYFNKLNECYESLQKISKENYISQLIKLSKTFLLIPYYYKSKIICEKILEFDKNNIEIIPSYIKCLQHFREYSKITEILNNIKSENDKIKELKTKNEERIKESKGEYNFKNIYLKFKNDKKYDLELAEFNNDKISIQEDKNKGLIIVANEEIPKGELIIASKAIVYVPKLNNNLEKIKCQNEEHHFLLLNKIREKMVYTREDNPEIYELYDQENTNLSLEERRKNYIKNLSNKDIDIPDKTLRGIFTNTFQTKLYLYDEFPLAFGLFYYPSFMSHSCVPNVEILGIGDFMFIFTDRKINKNEELTIYYVENDEEFIKRQEKLKKQYGFECQCELCQIEKNKYKEMPDIKNKISKYINELIETSGQMFDYSVFNRKKKEVLNFMKKNNNKINNYEKGLLYFNLYFLNYGDYLKNYEFVKKALECYENEKDLVFNIMKYYCLLKMYKISYVFFNERCDEIRKKMLKLIQEAFGNKYNDFAEILLNDILELYTSDDDNDIMMFNMQKHGDDGVFGNPNDNCKHY